MFSKAEGPQGGPSIIASDVTITGDLISEGDIQLDGTLVGDVESRVLTIGEDAQVEGSVSAKELRVFGAVVGKVKADNVALSRNARVQGDIVHQNLAIEQGATLEGNLRRLDAAEQGRPKVSLTAVDKDDGEDDAGNGAKPAKS